MPVTRTHARYIERLKMLHERLKSDILSARKEGRGLVATRLQTMLAEAQRYAKDEMREVTDEDVARAAEKFVKGIDKTIEMMEDRAKIAEITIERSLYMDFIPEDPLMSMSLSQLVEHFMSENPGAPINKVGGLVMKTTKGKYRMDEVWAAIKEIENGN